MNASNVDKRIGGHIWNIYGTNAVGQYGGATRNNENNASGHPVGQNTYEDGYGIHQRHGALPPAAIGTNVGSSSAYVGSQSGSGSGPMRSGYEVSRGPAYDLSRATGYASQRMPVYDTQRGPSYDSQRSHVYDAQRGVGYDTHRGSVNDPSRGATYDAASRSLAVPNGQAAPQNNGPYGSATPPGRAGNAYEPPTGGGNHVRR